MNIFEKLVNVQNELKAPKNQWNKFGEYNYRSCEDILEALKPLLLKYKICQFINDEIYNLGDMMMDVIYKTVNGRLCAAEVTGHRELTFTKLYISA